ncbi:rRNA methyltransferase 2, mitochondrial [Phymastichus coffea]|uniref:rRNA methyltransferase 2, mitochondrial n=1 Tax=Phymastichus coffea TaxID=108790 RepID=UPI00273B1D62|nr:rRNA methyltransferase 2, mitochondrial [Phymastichus coffea]
MILRRFHTFNTFLKEKPVNLKNMKHSSQLWLTRQMKDPYVELAKQQNYRCRSAFKLLELNKRYKIFEPGMNVVDCGAAPGSWTQVAVNLTNANGKMVDEQKGKVIAIDKLPMHHVDGAIVYGNMDFTLEKSKQIILDSLQGKFVELVMSDMAPNSSGVKELDHENIIRLAYMTLHFALKATTFEGTLIVKLWDGSRSSEFEENVAKFYRKVNIVRPQATRSESSEKFILARGFKGIQIRATENK